MPLKPLYTSDKAQIRELHDNVKEMMGLTRIVFECPYCNGYLNDIEELQNHSIDAHGQDIFNPDFFKKTITTL